MTEMDKFYQSTGEACEHYRFAKCTNGAFFAIDMVRGIAWRRDSAPEYLICEYDKIAIFFGGEGVMDPASNRAVR